MVKSCCVYNCTQKATKGGVSFHSFPKNPTLRKQWASAIQREDFLPTESSRICGKHFQESDYIWQFGRKRLKDDIIPSVHLQKVQTEKIKPNVHSLPSTSTATDEEIASHDSMLDLRSKRRNIRQSIYFGNHGQGDLNTTEASWRVANKQIRSYRAKIKLLRTKVCHQQKGIRSFQDLLDHLRERNEISGDCLSLLEYALEQPRLSKDAIPTIFSNYQLESSDGDTYCQPEMIKLEPLVIEDIKIEDGESVGIKIEAEDDSSPSRMIKLEPEIIDLKTETDAFECHCSLFEKLWNKELEITLPSDSWAIQNIKNTSYKKFISVSQMVCTEGKTNSIIGKQIILSENSLTFYVFNSLITDIFPEKEVHSLEELWKIIIRFDQMPICHGGMLITKVPQNFKNSLYFKDPVLEKWRHKMCKYVIVDNKNIDDTKCFFCKKIRKSVWYFKMKVEPCKMPKVKLLQRRCNNLQKKEKRLKMRFREIYEELKLARKTIREYSFTDNLET